MSTVSRKSQRSLNLLTFSPCLKAGDSFPLARATLERIPHPSGGRHSPDYWGTKIPQILRADVPRPNPVPMIPKATLAPVLPASWFVALPTSRAGLRCVGFIYFPLSQPGAAYHIIGGDASPSELLAVSPPDTAAYRLRAKLQARLQASPRVFAGWRLGMVSTPAWRPGRGA